MRQSRLHCLLVCIAFIEQMLLLQYSQFTHSPTLADFSAIFPRYQWQMVRWQGPLDFFQVWRFLFLRPHTALYVLIVLMCVPTMCLRSTLSSDPCPPCPPCRRLFVAQSTFHHLNFSHAATSLSPPADILLSTFVATSRPFWDCTDFSLRFRRIIIIVIVSDMFT